VYYIAFLFLNTVVIKPTLLMRPKIAHTLRFLMLALLLLGATTVSGQLLLNPPEPAPNQGPPSNGAGSGWTAICAGIGGFNSYYVDISFIGTPDATNEFILELSDANGSFTAPTELAREAGENNPNGQFFMEFSIPENTQGDGYKLRIRSTGPAKEAETPAYDMYYQGYTSNMNISQNGDGTTYSFARYRL